MLAARLATAAVLIAGLLAALFLLPKIALAAVLGALLLAGGHEWGRLCGLGRAGSWVYATAIGIGFLALALYAPARTIVAVLTLAALFWLVAVPAWLRRGVAARHAPLLATAGFLVLVPAALAMLALHPAEVLLVLGLVWIADTAAYFVGRAWGQRKLAPSISPGKTWEGAAAGVAAALAYAIICSVIAEGRASVAHLIPAVAGAALLAVLSIAGDLFESAVKRQAGVKDSGTLLPGHGGVLDRIDSATATLPVAALLLAVLRGAT